VIPAELRLAFVNENAGRLLILFQEVGGMPTTRADAAVHALVDILETIENIYGSVLPDILAEPGPEAIATLKERLWDLREELRHIDYHVHDSGLLDL
jgi:hypothetical protein